MLFKFDDNDRGNSPRKIIFGAKKEIAFSRSFRLKSFFFFIEFSKLFFYLLRNDTVNTRRFVSQENRSVVHKFKKLCVCVGVYGGFVSF